MTSQDQETKSSDAAMHLVEDLFQKTAAALAARQQLPESTYRLQFNAHFTFQDARRITPYLRDLGITHCYASPYLKARPGSSHGYDITDHRLLNPEIGTSEDYDNWIKALKQAGLGQVLDTVPNHMGISGGDNIWWDDVLENGPASPYAAFFDIAWLASHRTSLQHCVLLPFLGDPYGKVLEAQQIQLQFAGGAFTLHYFDHRFPVTPRSYELILEQPLEDLQKELAADSPALVEFQSILTAVRNLPRRWETDPARRVERQREKEVIKRRLATLTEENHSVREAILKTVSLFNGKAGDPRSFDRLDKLLDDQPYRLAYWRVASDEINYRRFFDVNELAALSMEREEVFVATHELILRLLKEQKISGLRIDHPDGLFDPQQYLYRLQNQYALVVARDLFETDSEYSGVEWSSLEQPLLERVVKASQEKEANIYRRPLYVIVEKILGTNEPLSEDWPVYGTTGYDFLNILNGLFVDPSAVSSFSDFYQRWSGIESRFPELVYQKKLLILNISLSSELHMLSHQLDRLAQKNRWSRDFTLNGLRHALREVIAFFPVYRSYLSEDGARDTDRHYVQVAVNRAIARNPTISRLLFRFIRDMLLLQYPESFSEEDRIEQRCFAGKFQQVTSPVMAKGVEDTAFYVYNRLASLNEVGGDADRFGVAPQQLHQYLLDRQARWPFALSALSTHDTKRSEDVRARLNVLSELPEEWQACIPRWVQLNKQLDQEVKDEGTVPDPNEEYLLYQTLIGAWPLEPYTDRQYNEFVGRIQAYMLKALHEAKVHTSWINPNTAYDDAFKDFVGRILDMKNNRAFLDDFRKFQKRISHWGLFNSLAQTLIRITAPGAPDTYQGTEIWDFSLVDPDNRRVVDYELRQRMLQELKARTAAAGQDRRQLIRKLLDRKEDGQVKLYLTWLALSCRRDNPRLFSAAEYLPVEVDGSKKDHVFSFCRHTDGRLAWIVVPRFLTRLAPDSKDYLLNADQWQDTRIYLPHIMQPARFENVFTGQEIIPTPKHGRFVVRLADVLADFPVALLLGRSKDH